jgi:Hypothetical glycosyl hydrolase family 15
MAAAVALVIAAAAFYVAAGQSRSGLQPISQPSSPRPSHPEPGIAVIRQTADSWRTASGYRSYSNLLVGLALARNAARQPGRSLVYFSGTDVNTHWNTGVPYAEARRRGWLLRDRAGNLLLNRRYASNYIGDVGNPAYQHAWVENVRHILRRNGDDGVFIDDVLYDLKPLTGTEAAKYPRQKQWANATLSFVKAVGTALRSDGYYVALNASGYITGDTTRDANGTNTITFWKELGPYAAGLMNEYYAETSDGSDRLRTTGSAWYQQWDGWQRLVGTAQSMGDDFFGLMHGSGGDALLMSYGKASFLLDWNGGGGAFLYQPSDQQDPWNGAWTRGIGRPEGQKQRVGTAWLRRYSGGIAVVNPNPSISQHLDLGRRYLSPTGTPISQLTLAPTTGLVLPTAP